MSLRRLSAVLVLGIATLLGSAGAAQAGTSQLSDQDRAFLQGAHQSNLAEIVTGKMAITKAQSQQVKDFGAMLVADHTKLDATVRELAGRMNVSLPDAPNAAQRALAARLQNASGDEFDAIFITGQITGHRMALQLGQRELSNGTDAAVKNAAASAAPVIARHLDMAVAEARNQGLPVSVQAGRLGTAQAPGHDVGAAPLALALGGVVLVASGAALAVRRHVVRA
jgi:putative membrane protein